jgi:hypothetical protein
LNAAVRQGLKASGTIGSEDHSFRILVQRQEMTVAVWVNADTGVHPDLLDSHFGYVAVSRASH